jgi:hypothetical protein
MWFLNDIPRLYQERQAIEKLSKTAPWLMGIEWVFERGLCLDAIIRVHDHDYEVRLCYPQFFPAVVPTVSPKDPKERWSTHQYPDGTLCLEWGPDTWHPDVTGAQVLESTYRLLDVENPPGTRTSSTCSFASSTFSRPSTERGVWQVLYK